MLLRNELDNEHIRFEDNSRDDKKFDTSEKPFRSTTD